MCCLELKYSHEGYCEVISTSIAVNTYLTRRPDGVFRMSTTIFTFASITAESHQGSRSTMSSITVASRYSSSWPRSSTPSRLDTLPYNPDQVGIKRYRVSSSDGGDQLSEVSSAHSSSYSGYAPRAFNQQQSRDSAYTPSLSSRTSSSIFQRRDSGYGYVDDRFSQASCSPTLTPDESITQIGMRKRHSDASSSTSSSSRALVPYGQPIGMTSMRRDGSGSSEVSAWSVNAEPYWCEGNKMYLRKIRPSWARGDDL